jgi:hypothetical protein
MKRTFTVLGLLAVLGGVSSQARAANLVENDKFKLNANGRLQWLGVGQKFDDSFASNNRMYLFMKQARLRVNGKYDGVKFDVQWAYGGEDIVAASPGIALSLQDFSFDIPLPANTWLKIGQFRVPYSRERITDSGTLNFGDRSIQSLGFSWNRDVGAALHTYQGKFAGTIGVFTGGGRDVPQRYLPEKLGSPMLVGRFGYDDGVDEDIYDVSAQPTERGRVEKAFYLNALYLKDTLIGHSTVLNVRSTDKSLLINSNWNPFIAQAPLTQATVWQAGTDAVVRKPIGRFTASAEAEANYAHFSNPYGAMALKGGRVQVGAFRNPVDVNLRYAVLFLDTRMANTYTPATGPALHSPLVTGNKPMQELTPSLTYHYKPNVAVTVDLPILFNMVVFQENAVGAYLANEQPDQTTVVKPGTTRGTGWVERQTVPEARILFQVTF